MNSFHDCSLALAWGNHAKQATRSCCWLSFIQSTFYGISALEHNPNILFLSWGFTAAKPKTFYARNICGQKINEYSSLSTVVPHKNVRIFQEFTSILRVLIHTVYERWYASTGVEKGLWNYKATTFPKVFHPNTSKWIIAIFVWYLSHTHDNVHIQYKSHQNVNDKSGGYADISQVWHSMMLRWFEFHFTPVCAVLGCQ